MPDAANGRRHAARRGEAHATVRDIDAGVERLEERDAEY
jgi:hypothetical protein